MEGMEGFVSIGLSLLEWNQCILDIPRLPADSKLEDALNYVSSNKLSRLAVVDDEDYFLGILEPADFLELTRRDAHRIYDQAIEDYARPPELVVYEEQGLEYNLRLILDTGTMAAIVLNREGKLRGEIRLNLLANLLRSILYELHGFVSGVIGSVDNGIIAINAQGSIVFMNRLAEQIINHRSSELMGRDIQKCFPESKTYAALENGKAQREIRLTINEHSILADFVPIDVGGKIMGAVAILKDVNEHDLFTDKVSSNDKLMAMVDAIVENSYEGMVVIDDQERVVLINQFFLELMGMSTQDVVGKHIHEVSPQSELPKILKTGITQFGESWKVGGEEFMIMRVPIQRDGKIIGALGKTLFKNMGIAKLFAKKVIRLEDDLAFYKEELRKFHKPQFSFVDIMGESELIKKAKALALRASRTTSTVLLLGESGTGKEVFAHAIHKSSLRKKGPFIRVNCAALPENLLESELFGYAEGAFTGARKGGKPGKFELADKGAIFLDEIGDMSLGMQAKLLRVLQEREVERLGATQPVKVDVRIIAATNRDLNRMVAEHKFRLDLYYRLNVITIELPPLRERTEDIEQIAYVFIERLNQRLGTLITGISPEALKVLMSYSWPGNIRELENILERAMIICDESVIYPHHLSLPVRGGLQDSNSPEKQVGKTLEDVMGEAERKIILSTLKQTKGNKVQAARLLGIHRSVLYKKMSHYNL